MEKNEAIALKGCRDGVKVLVSRDADIREVLDSLHEKAREYKSFFKGKCNIIITGRNFSNSDMLRINSIMAAIMPECPVTYENDDNVEKKEEEPEAEESIPDKDIFEEEKRKNSGGIQKAILKFFGAKNMEENEDSENQPEYEEKTDRMIEVRGKLCEDIYIYNGSVKKNHRLRAPGSLLIEGDIEEGAEVVAIGNIYVFGKVRGRIWAGCNGDSTAGIISYDLAPDEMRISDVYLRYPNAGVKKRRPEKAYLSNNTIYIDEYL